MSAPFPSALCLAAALLLTAADSLSATDLLPVIVTDSGAKLVSSVAASENLPLIVPSSFSVNREAEAASHLTGKVDKKSVDEKKNPASASESASTRAREEWQKQFVAAGGKAQSEKTKSSKDVGADSKAARSSNAAKKKKLQAAARQVAKPALPIVVPKPVRVPAYAEMYRTISFSRAEYDADPSYRHNATMELLLKQLRPIAPRVDADVNVTIQSLSPYRDSYPVRSGYRVWSRYPWH